jgi:aspartate/methionine/tyrosine aminotransferase
VPVSFHITRLLTRTGVAGLLPHIRRRVGKSAKVLHLLNDRVLATPLANLDDWSMRHEGTCGNGIDLAGTPNPPCLAENDRPVVGRCTESLPAAGHLTLRERIAERLESVLGRPVQSDGEVVVTHSARGAYHLVFDTFLNAGDRVVLFDPTSPFIIDAVRRRRARIRWLPIETNEPERLRRAIAGAKLVIVAQPSNPTGHCFETTVMNVIADAAQRYDALLIFDRSLAAWDAAAPTTVLECGRKRTLVIDRFASGGVGCLAGPEALIRPCVLTATDTVPPVPAILQQQAAAMLPDLPSKFAAHCQQLAASRRYAFDRLIHLGLEPTNCTAGPFIWVDVRQFNMTGREFCNRLAREESVWLAPGDRFGPTGKDHVRVTIAADEGRLREGLRRIEAMAGKYRVKATMPAAPLLVAAAA